MNLNQKCSCGKDLSQMNAFNLKTHQTHCTAFQSKSTQPKLTFSKTTNVFSNLFASLRNKTTKEDSPKLNDAIQILETSMEDLDINLIGDIENKLISVRLK